MIIVSLVHGSGCRPFLRVLGLHPSAVCVSTIYTAPLMNMCSCNLQVYAMDFPTQGLQRRDGRSLSLPTEVPDLQALLAPDSPYSGGPSQAR